MDLSHSMEIKQQELLLRHSQIISHASPVPRLAQNTHNPVLYSEGGGGGGVLKRTLYLLTATSSGYNAHMFL